MREAADVAAVRSSLSRCAGVASDCGACRRRVCVEAVGDALSGLIEVILAHAAREDPLLRGVGSPWAERHVEVHAGMAEAVCILTGLFVQSPALAETRLAQLVERFLDHDAVAAEYESPVVAFSS